MKKMLFLLIFVTFVLSAQINIIDDLESGSDNWILTGNWGIEEEDAHSGTHYLTESPGGNYTTDEISSATWASSLNLLMYEFGSIEFWCKYDIEDGWDFMEFQISTDDGLNWETKKTWTGVDSSWTKVFVSLDLYMSEADLDFRFIFGSDSALEFDGMHIDDVEIKADNFPNTGPDVDFSDVPVFYDAGPSLSFESYVIATDPDGVNGVWIEFRTNGGDFETVYAQQNIEEGWIWDFTIPETSFGDQVDFKITAMDGSEENLTTTSALYSYIIGTHLNYDSGQADYFKQLVPGQAMAVKISVPNSYHQLTTALIRNYDDDSDSLGDMKFHIWSDNGGVPGNELIAPFDVIPEVLGSESNDLFTRIDLRDKEIYLHDADYWIGISSDDLNVLGLMEAPLENGTTAYERSYAGQWNGSEWIWTQDPDYNYQFRAVISGSMFGIENDNIIPEKMSLYQNYPNPFNPVTQISFDLMKTSEVKLNVYNANGQLVSEVAKGVMKAGYHSVEFNGSKLNSGIYFYKLSAGERYETRKMLLVK